MSLHLTLPWRRSRSRLSRLAGFVFRAARSAPEIVMTEERLFSRLVRVDALPRDGQVVTIEATPAEREALASFYQASGHRRLDSDVAPRPLGPGRGARYRRCPRRTHSSLHCFARAVPCDRRRGRGRAVRAADSGQFQIQGGRGNARRFRSPTKTSPIPLSTEKSISALSRRNSSLSASIPIRASPTRSSMRKRTNSEPTKSPFAALARRDKAGRE